MNEKSVFRVGAAGLDPRDWRLIEIVFRHSQYNRYEFRLVARVEADGVDILIANRAEAQGLEAIERACESIVPVPVIDAIPRGATSSSRHAISIDRLTLQLLPILNRVVETELLTPQAPAAGGADIAARSAAAPQVSAPQVPVPQVPVPQVPVPQVPVPQVPVPPVAALPAAMPPAAASVAQTPAEAGAPEASAAPEPPGAPGEDPQQGGTRGSEDRAPVAQAPRAMPEPPLPAATRPESPLPESPLPESMHRESMGRESMGRESLPESVHPEPSLPDPSPSESTQAQSQRSNLLQFPRAPTAEGAGRLRVLVVDDSPTVRRQLAMAFERLGLACDAASSAAEALDRLEELHYDLVLVDVVMPDMDGYKLTREIRRDRRLRGIPVIILTSRSSPFDLARGALAGCDTYLTKPVPFRALEAAVLRQLRRSLAIDDLAGLVRSPGDGQGDAPERPVPVRSRVARFFGR